ncbi:MAG: MotA/TolQ/ExbB proton channel family protein [Thermodesulfobacteriota bacterium]|nr:MotA/TolQ/ExbB proton channel family protein [Thermodesulfobacteriota bacterium]
MPFFSSTAYAATTQFSGHIGVMVIDADPVVKLVLLTLFVFSIISWAIVIRKWVLFGRAKHRSGKILDRLRQGGTMVDLQEHVDDMGPSPVSRMFHEGREELVLITSKGTSIPMSMLTNVENRIASCASTEAMQLSGGLGFLASISNASPFIGLFGTVWGIMDSFREIGVMGSASLATVAPGISEALIATAAGLFVAIPAVLFYNYFISVEDQITSQMDRFQIDFMNWIRRGMIHGEK